MSDSLMDRSKIAIEESAKAKADVGLERFFRPIVGLLHALADGVETARPLEDEIQTISAQARRLSQSMQDYGSELRGYRAWAKNF
jgi:hypothetical protein